MLHAYKQHKMLNIKGDLQDTKTRKLNSKIKQPSGETTFTLLRNILSCISIPYYAIMFNCLITLCTMLYFYYFSYRSIGFSGESYYIHLFYTVCIF